MMRVTILKDTTTEGLEQKINKVIKENQGAINSIQYQALALPQYRGEKVTEVKTTYTAMIQAW